MSVAAKKWVRKHSPATGSRKTVLAELAWDADEAGRGAHLSTEQLVSATGLSRSTVKRALARLIEAQLIVRHQGGRGHCYACAAARRGAHVFDVVIPDLPEASDPAQMNLLDQVQNGADVDLVQNCDPGQGDPGSWSTLDQQEEYEEVSLSLEHVEESEERNELPSLDAEVELAAHEGGRGRARGAACKPVTYRGRTVPRETVTAAVRLLGVFNDATGATLGPRTGDGRASQALKQIVGALIERPDEPAEVWERGVRAMVADPPEWVEGRLIVGHVFGQRAAEHTLARGRSDAAPARNGRRGMTAADWGAIADNLEAQGAAA